MHQSNTEFLYETVTKKTRKIAQKQGWKMNAQTDAKRISKFLISVAVIPASDAGSANEDLGPVKKSQSGICHCPGGQFYERTVNFTEFETIGACLASGGQEPQRGQGTCPTEPASSSISSLVIDNYDREAFGGWTTSLI